VIIVGLCFDLDDLIIVTSVKEMGVCKEPVRLSPSLRIDEDFTLAVTLVVLL
jgi:hypothetical protein